MAAHPHVAVIGSGIVGASIAFHLARRGARVTVFDGGRGGGGEATPRSWAWINASWGNPPPYVALRMRSMAEWRRLGGELPALGLRWPGGLLWDLPPDDLERYADERNAVGYEVRKLGRAEALALEPELANPPALALHAPGEGVVEPAEAAAAFLQAAVSLGARSIGGRVAGIDSRGVATDAGAVAADHVVIAAGAGSVELADSAGYRLPLDTPPGLLVSTEPAPPLLNGLVMAPELHVRQMPNGGLIAGTDFGGMDPAGDPEGAAARLFSFMQEALRSGPTLRFSHYTVGHRPTPRDGFPVVGRLPDRDDVSLAVMHSGVTLAPAVGLLLADEILGGAPDPLLAPYRPERFVQS